MKEVSRLELPLRQEKYLDVRNGLDLKEMPVKERCRICRLRTPVGCDTSDAHVWCVAFISCPLPAQENNVWIGYSRLWAFLFHSSPSACWGRLARLDTRFTSLSCVLGLLGWGCLCPSFVTCSVPPCSAVLAMNFSSSYFLNQWVTDSVLSNIREDKMCQLSLIYLM